MSTAVAKTSKFSDWSFSNISSFPASPNHWRTTPGSLVAHMIPKLVNTNQWSFSFRAQSDCVWQWSKQLAAGISKHHWGGGYTVLTPSVYNGLNCASELIGPVGNRTECAHWITLVNVEINFSQEFRAASQSSLGTWCKCLVQDLLQDLPLSWSTKPDCLVKLSFDRVWLSWTINVNQKYISPRDQSGPWFLLHCSNAPTALLTRLCLRLYVCLQFLW